MTHVPIEAMPLPHGAMALETYELTKRFGSFTALDGVTMKVRPGTVSWQGFACVAAVMASSGPSW